MTARLNEKELAIRARGFGFKLLTTFFLYESNESVLTWRCNRSEDHLVDTTLGHLRRGCPQCRQESRESERRYAEFDAVAAIIGERGDILLSGPGDYVNQTSEIKYVCCLCGEEGVQAAAKVKKGQRHICQKMAGAQRKRRDAAYEAVKQELAKGRIELLTPVSEYEGLRSTVAYRLTEEESSGEATVLRLQRMATKRAGECGGVE